MDPSRSRPTILYLLTSEISSVFLRGQLGFLRQQGFDVVAGAKLSGNDVTAKFDERVRVIDIPFVREPRPMRDVRALVATFRAIRRVSPSLVNASTPKAGLIGMVAAKLARVKVRVYVVRGLRFETLVGARRRLMRGFERVAIRCATHVIFNSRSTLRVAEQEGVIRKGRGLVLGSGSGNGLDVSRFSDPPSRERARQSLGLETEGCVIGFVGRLTRDKGIVDLVGAFSSIAPSRPRLKLLLVGSFEEGDPVDGAIVDEIQRNDRIIHIQWTEELPAVYSSIDVLAFPSYREGLPNVPLEAQFCGVPVVGYAASGTVDAVRDGETGVLVRLGDVQALAAALGDLADDPMAGRRLGDQGRRWVSDAFDQERLWTSLLENYVAWLSPG
jgi:glycosyltransferase involved in cell wall biosynthesis